MRGERGEGVNGNINALKTEYISVNTLIMGLLVLARVGLFKSRIAHTVVERGEYRPEQRLAHRV